MRGADKARRKLEQKVICQYSDGKISAGCAAELLGISLREWYDLLEKKHVPVNWGKYTFLDAGEATFGGQE
jgi:predicted HTH domain antitoxin